MGEKGRAIELSVLAGFNENPAGRLLSESPDCENVIGGPRGFSVWRGRKPFFRDRLTLGANSKVFSVKWPDGHPSLMVFQDGNLGALETGILHEITGDLTFSSDKRNPISMASYSRNRYVCGADYQRSQPWYWDGKIDHNAEAIETTDNPRVVCEFGGCLWGLGFENTPLYAWYSKRGEVTFTGAGAMEFRDGFASTLVGMRQLNRNMALVWGDKGLWAVQFSSSWPEFSTQQIDPYCDCVSDNSIVTVPGQGIFWQGRNTLWALVGNSVIDIGISPDGRKVQRIYDLLRNRPQNSLQMCASFWRRKRNGILFSWPSVHCHAQKAFNEPKGLFLALKDLTLWPVSYGVESAAEWLYNNELVVLGSNRDGNIDIVDYNLDEDYDDLLTWHWESEWAGNAVGKTKFVRAYLSRPASGTRYVAAKFWKDYERDGVTGRFDLGRDYDAVAEHPSYDPGGPADEGLPPAPEAVCEARIGLTGRRIKVRLSNEYGDDVYQGPEIPMESLTILTR